MVDTLRDPFTGSVMRGGPRKQAIDDLAPGALYDSDGDGTNVVWREEEANDDGNVKDNPQAQPSEAAIRTKIDEYNADWVTYEYWRNRLPEYQLMGNQDEMRSDDEINGTTTWIDAIKAIKAKWPKDNSGPIE